MVTGNVRSSELSVTTAATMASTVEGSLNQAITDFIAQGDTLQPDNFDGPSAHLFYGEWPQYKTTLTTAVAQLADLAADLKLINAEIQAAGGNV
ncbi:MAG TPA: hypothetical protein VFB94_15750 [Acidimicrobiales bacterium]|jgi:uncharacterized protein YukE|nr:hypothetical protein [Acidimicrobiales bacterium]